MESHVDPTQPIRPADQVVPAEEADALRRRVRRSIVEADDVGLALIEGSRAILHAGARDLIASGVDPETVRDEYYRIIADGRHAETFFGPEVADADRAAVDDAVDGRPLGAFEGPWCGDSPARSASLALAFIDHEMGMPATPRPTSRRAVAGGPAAPDLGVAGGSADSDAQGLTDARRPLPGGRRPVADGARTDASRGPDPRKAAGRDRPIAVTPVPEKTCEIPL